MNKKNWLFLLLAAAFVVTFNSCKKSDDTDTSGGDTGPTEWVRSAVFTGDPRSNAAYFQIGDKGYLVGGLLTNNTAVKDAFSFDGDKWSRIAEFPGTARHSAVAFAVGGKGYVGLGANGATALSDFYEYDPATNNWTEITAELPEDKARYGAVGFALGNSGYVGLGATENNKRLSDMYRFNPTNKTWESVSTQFKQKRVYAFAFVIGNKAYIGGGFDNNQYPEDFFSYDGQNWSELNPIRRDDSNYTYDLTRERASTFTIGDYGYVIGGRKGSTLGNVWKYEPASDTWTDKHQAIQGSFRDGAASFSIDGKGYVVTGMNGTSKFDDNWVFTPVR